MWQLWTRIYLTHYRHQWLGAVNTVVTLVSRLQVFCAAGLLLAFERGLCSLRSVVNNHTHTHNVIHLLH